MKVIPAIDLKDGSCVRLFKGDFDKVTEYSRNPAEVALRFYRMGFDYLHVVDLDGARSGSPHNSVSVREICAATPMSVQLGGGLRTAASLQRWFDAGVSRCVVGSIAVTEPATVREWLREFSPDRIVLALDVQIDADGVPHLATHGWTATSETVLWDRIEDFVDSGLQHVLCTDVSRDGALSGPNLDLYRQFNSRYPHISLQASGGVRDAEDLRQAASTGASGAITGRALLDGRISAEELRSLQQNA